MSSKFLVKMEKQLTPEYVSGFDSLKEAKRWITKSKKLDGKQGLIVKYFILDKTSSK